MPLFIILLLLYFCPAQAEIVHIIAVGDVLLHSRLQQKGMEKGFKSLWYEVIPQLTGADLTYANLEGPAAEMIDSRGRLTQNKKEAYTSYPAFNYPPRLISDLKGSGFNIVSTANNHILDRHSIGIDKTIAALQASSMAFTGIRRRDSQGNWHAETPVKGFTIAWLACTEDTNGIADTYQQVLHCSRDKEQILLLVKALSRNHDAVIVTPHWGVEYQNQPSQSQQTFAQALANAGVLAILGSHPHCVQRFTWLKTEDNKKVFVAYSLGNFISNQGSLKNRASGLLSLRLEKRDGVTFVADVRYQPTYMENRGSQLELRKVTSANHPAYRLLQQVIGKDYLSVSE